MEISPTQVHAQIDSLFDPLRLLDVTVPHHALPIDPWPTPSWYPWVSELTAPTSNDILPSLLILPYHYFLMFTTPETISFGEEIALYPVEGWMPLDHCQMDYTGVKFSTWVNQSLVIDPKLKIAITNWIE